MQDKCFIFTYCLGDLQSDVWMQIGLRHCTVLSHLSIPLPAFASHKDAAPLQHAFLQHIISQTPPTVTTLTLRLYCSTTDVTEPVRGLAHTPWPALLNVIALLPNLQRIIFSLRWGEEGTRPCPWLVEFKALVLVHSACLPGTSSSSTSTALPPADGSLTAAQFLFDTMPMVMDTETVPWLTKV